MRTFVTRHLPLALIVATAAANGWTPISAERMSVNSIQSGRGATAVAGGGWYLLQNAFETQFGFSAVLRPDGSASGAFHHRTEDSTGTIDFHARVTCVAVDAENRRAWIGGVITANRSTNPSFTGEIHQVGHDIWFRVLDASADGSDADRTTFIGFESPAIPSSESYCQQRIWPEGPGNPNLRTWPVTSGNLTIAD